MTTDLFTTLRAADPARGRDGYSDDELTRLAGEVARRADAEGAGLARPLAPPRPAARRLWPVLPAAAAAAALALVLGPALTGNPSASAEAAELLNEAADNITSVDPPADPSQWWEVTTTGFYLSYGDDTIALLRSETRARYVAVDGSRPTVMVDGPSQFLRQLAGPPARPDDVARLLGDDGDGAWTSTVVPNDALATWSAPTPAFLADLPRDPAALRDRLYADTAGHGPSPDTEAFSVIATTLRTGIVPADLRAALYRVLATVPGVEITTRSATVGSVTGVAFAQDVAPNGFRQEIVIDPTTGALVGERQVAIANGDGLPEGTVIEETSVTRTLVDTVPADVLSSAVVKACWLTADRTIACRND